MVSPSRAHKMLDILVEVILCGVIIPLENGLLESEGHFKWPCEWRCHCLFIQRESYTKPVADRWVSRSLDGDALCTTELTYSLGGVRAPESVI